MIPTRRDFKFNLPGNHIHDWHGRGSHVSHLFNALSIVFPVGERFFINSVRAYKERISDAELGAMVRGFIGQEAMHGREHEAYNELTRGHGLPEAELEHFVAELLASIQKATPPSWQLAITLALEHLTAILADHLLERPTMLEDSEPAFRDLWRWHALEETEHKAVAFDVWDRIMGRGALAYATRSMGMLATSAVFFAVIAVFTICLAESDPASRRRPSGYAELLSYLFQRPGMLRTGFPAWLRYFKTSFHPWQHNNRHLFSVIDDIVAQMEARAEMSQVD
jgi:predicted metal-dependent hydrolase